MSLFKIATLHQRKINEPELKKDFNDFCRRNGIFGTKHKSLWNSSIFKKIYLQPFQRTPLLRGVFESGWKRAFWNYQTRFKVFHLSKEEWRAIRSLADDKSIVIKKADKDSCVVVWNRSDYVLEAEKQVSGPSVYRDLSNSENILTKLSEVSNKMFSSLRRKSFITEKQLKYFIFEYKKPTNFGKLYLLPKIHKRLFDFPGRSVISNCGTPTEKCSQFLDNHLKNVMQKGWSYIKYSGDFIKKINNLVLIPENAILLTADVEGLYPTYHMKWV